MQIQIEINGQSQALNLRGNETLLGVLRDRLGSTSATPVCDDGACGRCVVQVNGLDVCACILLAGSCRDRSARTIEGMSADERPDSLPPLTYLHHSDLSILLQAQMEGGERFRPLAGGSDLIPLLKHGVVTPEAVLDIGRVETLRGLHRMPGSGLLIGALVTLGELETSPLLSGPYAALAEAAASAGPPPIRNVGTVGGNLLQRPRCPYFRAAVPCWLNGGDDCPAREGENTTSGIFEDGTCVATHPSDLATAALVLRAAVHTRSAWNERVWPLDQFLRPPMAEYRDETALEASELITHLQLAEPSPGLKSVYVKETAPGWSFALVAVGLAAVADGRHLSDVRLSLGGVATVPRREPAAERILSEGELDGARIEGAIAAALEGARPLSQNGYKLPLLATAIRRAVERLCER